MASLYKRNGSPYWWIKYQVNAVVRRESTGLRFDDHAQTRSAHELKAEKTLAELRTNPKVGDEHWECWVLPFLEGHCKSPLTLVAYKKAWSTLRPFLAARKIVCPRQLTHAHCRDYHSSRTHPPHGRAVNSNTARDELLVLCLLMSEAVRLGFSPTNPCRNLGIPTTPRKLKPEFSNENLEAIQQAIECVEDLAMKTFMQMSFLIARYQGCRCAETRLNPMTDVKIAPDGQSGRIHFRIKGDRDHVAPLHPKLIPLFQRLQAEGCTETYPLETFKRGSRAWSRLMASISDKLPAGACFHSLRVTVVSRLARDSVSMAKAMRFVGHASQVVHQVYQRLNCEDLDDCLTAVN